MRFFIFLMIFIISSCSTVSSHHTKTWVDNVYQDDKVYNALMGVGINTIRDWRGCIVWNGDPVLGGQTYEYKNLFKDGWQHLNYIICAQEHFPNDKIDEKYVRAFLLLIRKQAREIHKDYPDRAFVITFKGRDSLCMECPQKTKLYKRIENSQNMQNQYIRWWQIAAEIFKDDTYVAFSIMNEPDYRRKGGLKDWQKLHTRVIDEIRMIAPHNWIQLEGTYGSVVCRDMPLTEMLKPIPRKKIMYAFHCWPKFDFAEQESGWNQYWPKVKDSQIKYVRTKLKEVTQFKKKFNVPVVINEFGLFGKTPNTKGGTKLSERAKYIDRTIMLWHNTCKCGLTWWAYGDNHTPYIRQQEVMFGRPEFLNDGQRYPLPIIDEDLFIVLGLIEW